MPGLGISASRSSSTSQSSSENFGINGSGSQSFSQGLSQSGGQSTQGVAFEDLFRQLFQGATGAAATAAQNTPLFQGESAQLFSGGLDFLKQLQAVPDTTQQQLGALSSGLGDLFNEQLLPGITGQSVAAGNLGGSRHGVAQAQAAKQVAGQYAQGAAGILSNAGAQQIQAAGTGLAALPQLAGLAQGGANASLSPYLALAQILGGPTVLTQSSQFGQSSDIARAISESFGLEYGSSQSTSSSKAKSTSVSAGV